MTDKYVDSNSGTMVCRKGYLVILDIFSRCREGVMNTTHEMS